MTTGIDDKLLYAEIERHRRRRFLGVYLTGATALLLLAGALYSLRMMHGPGWTTATATIVALGQDPSNGEPTMTSEFTDAAGTLRRDTQPASYYYAAGGPQPGKRIGYLYKTSELTGDFHALPRADGILRWALGLPAALFGALTALLAWIVLRQRNFRRRLVRSGRREAGELYTIRQHGVPFVVDPKGRNARMWRLEARYFEPSRSEFVDCHSDWQTPPTPELRADSALPPVLVDPARPRRYWLPVSGVASR